MKITLATTINDIRGILSVRPHPQSRGVTIHRKEASAIVRFYDRAIYAARRAKKSDRRKGR